MSTSFQSNLKQKIALVSYSLIWLLITPVALLHFIFQKLRGKAGYSRLRLSRYGWLFTQNTCRNGWLIHCASVGEVVAIQALVEQLLLQQPNRPIMLTTNTTTGADRVKLLFADRVKHAYLPYDFPLFIHAFLAQTRPEKVLINEMELWPNWIDQCYKKRIPVIIINGRMSEKSTKTYQKFPILFRPMFEKLSVVCAQSQRDYTNYQTLGVRSQQLFLTNNIKFDLSVDPTDIQQSQTLNQQLAIQNRLILVAASTHEPEEQIVLDAYLALSKRYPTLLLIIVPRHPQRFEKVHQLLNKQQISSVLASQKIACNADTQVLLCDQMGMLRAIYALADIAFVGGSIAKRGGHNALEPAAVGVPILMGESTYNNPAICQALEQSEALHTVTDSAQIVAQCEKWLDNPTLRMQQGQSGKKVIAQNSGAIHNTLAVLAKLP
jgi:3-deoxy-D-manno-octulosonic-acid transferase